MAKLHPLERIRLDGMRPVTRVYWLWRTLKQRGEKRQRAKRYVVVHSADGTQALAVDVRAKVVKPLTPKLLASTYAGHVAQCGQCSTSTPCAEARERWGAL